MYEEPINLLGIPPEDWAITPESVRLALLSLLDIVRAQSGQITDLQTQVRDLQAKAGQTSRNSSKPPSSDPPSAPPKPPKVPRGRNAGGQPGHAGTTRPLVPPERVDEPIELLPNQCPGCATVFAADLPTLGGPRRTQVFELPVTQPHIIEYRQHTRCCPGCRQLVTADLPPDAPPGAFGSRATALIALLRGRFRLSINDVAECLTELWNLPLCTASVVMSCERVSAALAPLDAAIAEAVQTAPSLNVDETSWPTETRRGWLWVAVSPSATCFRIHPSRSGPALRALLGEAYYGIVGSDRYLVYDQFADRYRQLCWAHLVRNLRGLLDCYAEETRWAQPLLALSDELFLAWHLYKGGWIDRVSLQQGLLPVRYAMRQQLQEGVGSAYPKIAGFSQELLKHWDALWTFSQVEGIEPTNNAAEQALRHAVLWRKSSFGSRSAAGCRFVERILSMYATCRQQGRSFITLVTEAVQAAWSGAPAPVLFPAHATA
jgi:transposase